MKTLVDCDFVFNVLTRGPFPPIGDQPFDSQHPMDADAIENHLVGCHECRQLAEALIPTVDLFHEALSDEERATLPAFNDTEMMSRLHSTIIEAVFESEEDPVRIRRIDRLCQRWLAPAMVIVPLIAASILTWMFADASAFSQSHNYIASLTKKNQTSIRDMNLPASCLTPVSLVSGDRNQTLESNIGSDSSTVAILKSTPHANGQSNCDQCHEVSPSKKEKSSSNVKASCLHCHNVAPNRESPIDKHHYRCCTSCHAAGNQMPSVGGHPMFAAACGSCHTAK